MPLHTGEILMNQTVCVASANATTTSIHLIHKHAMLVPESVPVVCTILPDLIAKDAAISTTEVLSILAVKLVHAICWVLSDLLALVINAAVMPSLDSVNACPMLSEELVTNVHQITGNWPAEKDVSPATAIHSTPEVFHATSSRDNVNATMVSEVVHVMTVLMVSTANLTDSVTPVIATQSVLLPANATVLLDSALVLMVPVGVSVTNASVDSLEPYQTANLVVNVLTTGMPSFKSLKHERWLLLLLPSRSVKLESLERTTKNFRTLKLDLRRFKPSMIKSVCLMKYQALSKLSKISSLNREPDLMT